MEFTLSVILAATFFSVFLAGTSDAGTNFGGGEPPKCTPTTCPDNAVCHDSDGFVFCQCPEGLTGPNCDKKDPCLKNTTDCKGIVCYGDCPPNTACESATGLAHCRGCVPGWTGMHCDQDDDECGFNKCENNGVCVNTIGSFKCTCTTGWTGSNCACKKGTACDVEELKDTTTPSSETTQLSPSLFSTLFVLSVSILWSCIGLSLA